MGEPDMSGSRHSVTPRRSFAAFSGETPIYMRAGILGVGIGLVFGAGVWATKMSTSIEQLTANATKTDAKLEKLEGLMMEMLRAQPAIKGIP